MPPALRSAKMLGAKKKKVCSTQLQSKPAEFGSRPLLHGRRMTASVRRDGPPPSSRSAQEGSHSQQGLVRDFRGALTVPWIPEGHHGADQVNTNEPSQQEQQWVSPEPTCDCRPSPAPTRSSSPHSLARGRQAPAASPCITAFQPLPAGLCP